MDIPTPDGKFMSYTEQRLLIIPLFKGNSLFIYHKTNVLTKRTTHLYNICILLIEHMQIVFQECQNF